MRVYEVRLLVKAESITTVLDVVKDSADLISMTQVSEPEPTKRKRALKSRAGRGMGVKIHDLVLERLKLSNATIEGLERTIKDKGYAATSARVAVNDLIRSGKVAKNEHGVYELA